MKQFFLAFALLLAYTSVSQASPVPDSDDRYMYPYWWRPCEDSRSYWDPIIARLIWTHPALRRYYRELAGWESSDENSGRPSLLSILDECDENDRPHDEHKPVPLAAYREGDKAENTEEEEHFIDRPEESLVARQELEEDPSRDGDAANSLDVAEPENETEQTQNNDDEIQSSDVEDGGEAEESEPASREQRSVHTETLNAEKALLSKLLLAVRSRLPGQDYHELNSRRRINNMQSGSRDALDGQLSGITVEQLLNGLGIDSEMLLPQLLNLDINLDDDILKVDVNVLENALADALVNVDADLDLGLVTDLLDSLIGRGGLVPEMLDDLQGLLGGQGGLIGGRGGLLEEVLGEREGLVEGLLGGRGGLLDGLLGEQGGLLEGLLGEQGGLLEGLLGGGLQGGRRSSRGGLLDGLQGGRGGQEGLIGGLPGRDQPSGKHDRTFNGNRHAALGEQITKRELRKSSCINSDVPLRMVPDSVSKEHNKGRLGDMDVHRLIDDLGLSGLETVRVHVRSANADDCTTETSQEGDTDDSPLVNAEVLTGDMSPLYRRKKRSTNSVSVCGSEAQEDTINI